MLGKLTSLDVIPYIGVSSSAQVQAESHVGAVPSGCPARHELIASMVGFPDELSPFNPLAYHCPESRAAYTTLDSLLRPEGEWGTPPAPYQAPKEEVVALALRWDLAGRLAICPAACPGAPLPEELCNLFRLVKPDTELLELRQIIDRGTQPKGTAVGFRFSYVTTRLPVARLIDFRG